MFRPFLRLFLIFWGVTLLPLGLASAQAEDTGPPSGSGSYDAFVALFEEFLEWKDPQRARGQTPIVDIAGQPTEQLPDYGEDAVEARREKMEDFQERLADMNVAAWDRAQQAEYLAVRAQFDQHDFLLNVARPWARDPGFYVDKMLRVTFADLPVEGDELRQMRARLRAIPRLVKQAKKNLDEDEVAADFADLAIHNLTTADGVGHGYPYRETPPPGVIGWYDDLLSRVDRQPELRAEVEAARAAAVDFLNWLRKNRSEMTADAGVGREHFNWYLKNVKLLPFTADELVLLGQRELKRLWAQYTLERHKNRDLPELEPAQSAEDYQSRIDRTDKNIRDFLVEEEIITIPDYIDELATNVPWIVRPQGRNYWEEVQYRDPHPDHLHAVIPGHRFDAVVERHNEHPIRGKITDGVRTEGWGVYLEEGMMHAGVMEDRPRVRELIYIFGIFRAARVPADVWLQLNMMSVAEAVACWMERTPFLDENVARVDAEIYLRRPPGYGLGYTVGMIQMQQLLADVRIRRGEDFVLKDFHDEFMAKGRLPLSLIRWEMTGLDDEVKQFWRRDPLPE